MRWAVWVVLLLCSPVMAGEGAEDALAMSEDGAAWVEVLQTESPEEHLEFVARFPESEYAVCATDRMLWLLKQRINAAGDNYGARCLALRHFRKTFLPGLVLRLHDLRPSHGKLDYLGRYEAASYIDGRWWLYGLSESERTRLFRELRDGYIAILIDPVDDAILHAACRALGDLGDPAALQPLVTLLNSDTSSSAIGAISQLDDPRVAAILLPRLPHRSSDTIINVCENLRDPACIGIVRELAESSEPWTRRKACEALGSIGEVGGLPTLLARAGVEEEDEWVRQSAIEALGGIGDARAIPLLATTVKSESLHTASIGALSRISTDESVEILVGDIIDQSDLMAFLPSRALAACEHPDSVPSLLAALYEKRVWHLSFTMTDSGRDSVFDGAEIEYQRFSGGMCVMRVWAFRSIDRLLAALEDERDSVRGSAVYAIALARVRDPRTVNVLIPLLKDETLAASAAYALGCFGDVRAVEPLIAALDSDNVTLRRFAAHGLGALGDGRAVAPLMKLLDDPDVRFAAVEALKTMKAQEAAPRLAAMLKDVHDPEPESYLAPNEIPGEIISIDSNIAPQEGEFLTPDPGAVPASPLRESLPRKLYRRDLLDALRWIGNPVVAPTLLEIAKDRADPLRDEVLGLLSEMGHGADPDVLFEFITDEDEDNRFETAVALGRVGDKRATDLLLSLLQTEDWDTRAMEALGYTKDRRAVAPLVAVLSERDSGWPGNAMQRRQTAIEALGRIGDPSAVEPLLRHLECARAAPREQGSIDDDVSSVESALVRLGDERAIEPLLAPWKQGKTMLDGEFVTDFPGTQMVDAIAAVMLDSDYDAEIREWAAVRFRQAEREDMLPALRKALHDPDADVRGAACWAIWAIRPPTDDEVEAMLFDPELTYLVGPEIFDRLTHRGRLPRSSDEAVRYLILRGARYDLIALWPRTRRLLFADLHGDSPDRQLYGARCLIRIGYGEETIPELVATLEKSDDERMARDFINTDKGELRQAAMSWSQRTGKSLDSARPAALGWGAMKEK